MIMKASTGRTMPRRACEVEIGNGRTPRSLDSYPTFFNGPTRSWGDLPVLLDANHSGPMTVYLLDRGKMGHGRTGGEVILEQ